MIFQPTLKKSVDSIDNQDTITMTIPEIFANIEISNKVRGKLMLLLYISQKVDKNSFILFPKMITW